MMQPAAPAASPTATTPAAHQIEAPPEIGSGETGHLSTSALPSPHITVHDEQRPPFTPHMYVKLKKAAGTSRPNQP